MSDWSFSRDGTPMHLCASGALWWPERRLLCVADLHLGRSERLARRGGGLLPPYETAETIDRLAAEIDRRAPAIVVCLGDSFDDGACEAGLGPADRDRLLALMAGRDWVWIAGNHDPGPVALGGRHLAELRLGSLIFRHAPEPDAPEGEVAGHLHPRFARCLRGHVVRRPCFLHDGRRLVLPAFGAYTGGLAAEAAAEAAGLDPGRTVAVLTGTRAVALPLLAGRGRARALERAS
jgi:DNA ligase-associated metallophosphoesterase